LPSELLHNAETQIPNRLEDTNGGEPERRVTLRGIALVAELPALAAVLGSVAFAVVLLACTGLAGLAARMIFAPQLNLLSHIFFFTN
jgi:hypothetical protein